MRLLSFIYYLDGEAEEDQEPMCEKHIKEEMARVEASGMRSGYILKRVPGRICIRCYDEQCVSSQLGQ